MSFDVPQHQNPSAAPLVASELGENRQATDEIPPQNVPLPHGLSMGAMSFAQQREHQQRHQGGGRDGERQRARQYYGAGRGRGGGGQGREAPSTPNGVRGRDDRNVTKIAPTTGIPFGHVPAYLPGSSSLVEELDTRIMVVLRDGRHLVGVLRSFDQYGNMVLEEVSERKFHRSKEGIIYFADIFLGGYIARGDSMVMLGQVGLDNVMKKVECGELEAMVLEASAEQLEWDFDKDLLA